MESILQSPSEWLKKEKWPLRGAGTLWQREIWTRWMFNVLQCKALRCIAGICWSALWLHGCASLNTTSVEQTADCIGSVEKQQQQARRCETPPSCTLRPPTPRTIRVCNIALRAGAVDGESAPGLRGKGVYKPPPPPILHSSFHPSPPCSGKAVNIFDFRWKPKSTPMPRFGLLLTMAALAAAGPGYKSMMMKKMAKHYFDQMCWGKDNQMAKYKSIKESLASCMGEAAPAPRSMMPQKMVRASSWQRIIFALDTSFIPGDEAGSHLPCPHLFHCAALSVCQVSENRNTNSFW